MKLIAHRGNINGPQVDFENHPDYVDKAISLGYDVEVDIWHHEGKFYLGHDSGVHQVSVEWFSQRKANLWIHCKNLKALTQFNCLSAHINFNYFWHQTDDYTLTSQGYIWAYPGKAVTDKSIIVMPEWIGENWQSSLQPCYAICSDYVETL